MMVGRCERWPVQTYHWSCPTVALVVCISETQPFTIQGLGKDNSLWRVIA